MAQQIIDLGTLSDGSDGDTNKVAWNKAKDNFAELYDATSAAQSTADAAINQSSFKNRLINGDFAVNQRVFAGGALAAGVYGFDRWKAGTGGCNVSLSAGVLTHTSGAMVQVIEAPGLASQTVVVSVEDPSGSVAVDVDGVTGTITSGTGRRGVSIAVPSGSTGNVTLKLTATGVTYKRVQLEVGSMPTAFDWRPAQVELAMCLRYFYARRQSVGNEFFAGGQNLATTSIYCFSLFPVKMCATPTVTISSYTTFELLGGASITAITPFVASKDSWSCTVTASGLTSNGYAVLLGHSTVAPWYINADAEL